MLVIPNRVATIIKVFIIKNVNVFAPAYNEARSKIVLNIPDGFNHSIEVAEVLGMHFFSIY